MSITKVKENERAFAVLFERFIAAHEEHLRATQTLEHAENAATVAELPSSSRSPAEIRRLDRAAKAADRAVSVACDKEIHVAKEIAAKRPLSIYGLTIKLRVLACYSDVPGAPYAPKYENSSSQYTQDKLIHAAWRDAEHLIKAAGRKAVRR